MGLSISISCPCCEHELLERSITRNLIKMCKEAGLYKLFWNGHNYRVVLAEELIESLKEGLSDLELHPGYYKKFNPENKWGSYDILVDVIKDIIKVATKYPKAEVVMCD